MAVVALTGGIGSGKSEAARQFSLLGVPVVDVDMISHTLTQAGTPVMEEIRRVFGERYLTADGALDRGKMRALVFDNATERLKLEAILHPAIQNQALTDLATNEHLLHPCYQILVIPLLFENSRYVSMLQKIIVVDCDEQLQIKRAMQRSQLTADQVKKIMASQVSRSTRLKMADEIIENNGTLGELAERITQIHEKLIKTCIVSK
ncbi:MAG: dephospho-CoA kinase [Methylotenera sp.]|nr:MAG: dephospho-CoA kinase [Methylotenera sp.]